MINIQKIYDTANLYIEKLILTSEPAYPQWNRETILYSKPAKWNYIDGCIIKALIMIYERTGDKRLFDYARNFTDFYIDKSGLIATMNPLDYNLDNINGGKNLIYLYRKTSEEKYSLAFEKLYYEQLLHQPRLKCGSFSHKAIYPSQIWLDGAYMALPFLAEYALIHNNKEIIVDIINQLTNIKTLMMDKSTGLYYHGYDETHSMMWADKQSGLSGEFWLRSIGWLSAALADLCEISYNIVDLYELCQDMLKELIASVSELITKDEILYQLPIKPKIIGNYPETSGSLLIAYSILKASRLGIVNEKVTVNGIKLLSTVTEKFININDDGLPVMRNICLVAGLGGKEYRSGSETYYLSEPIVENDAKGIAPYLMAYTELMAIL